MSFLDIRDPKKRDAIVAEYLATVNRLQNREERRAQDIPRIGQINLVLEPVVKSTRKITKELIPIREEIKVLNNHLAAKTNHEKQVC